MLPPCKNTTEFSSLKIFHKIPISFLKNEDDIEMTRKYTTRRNRNKTRRNTKKHHGGRGAFTTGASQELYQYSGTPGISRGGNNNMNMNVENYKKANLRGIAQQRTGNKNINNMMSDLMYNYSSIALRNNNNMKNNTMKNNMMKNNTMKNNMMKNNIKKN